MAAPYRAGAGRRIERRGLAAPLFFLALAAASIGSVHASPALWLATVIALTACAACWEARPIPRSVTSAAVAAFVLWLVLGNLLWHEAYTPAATFNATILAAGYVVGVRVSNEAWPALCVASLVAFALGVLWALLQVLVQGFTRASAGFETPGTLSIFLVMALVPACVASAESDARWRYAAVILLAAGVAAAASRAGYIALGTGLLAVIAARRSARLDPIITRRLVGIAGGLVVGFWVVAVGQQISGSRGERVIDPSISERLTVIAEKSGASRLELYSVARRAVPDHPVLGSGYLTFERLLEANRYQVLSYANESTSFAHNDYLQIILETGLVGLAFFWALLCAPVHAAWRVLAPKSSDCTNWIPALSALGVIAALAVHALFDYPFYVPVCLAGFGIAAGVLDRAQAGAVRSGSAHDGLVAIGPRWRTIARFAVIVPLVVLLLAPVLAEAAAAWANRNWRTARVLEAATWFEVARRVEPRDWRYHWYAGQFWFAQALQGRKPDAAARADAAFADAQRADPGEVRALIARIACQRELAALLPVPADPTTLRRWMAQAVAMAPLSADVRLEELRVLRFVGAAAEARSAAARMLNVFPNLPEARERWIRTLLEERG
ncbi:MAG TPA: O-antigen ligase family protein [Burkholderiales bacterium]